MNSLTQINAILDDHFAETFASQPNLHHSVCLAIKSGAISDFEEDFDEQYNSITDYVDLYEIKELCNFNTVMEICEYVAEKYEEFDMTFDKSYFEDNDKILKAYIYFYMEENHKSQYINEIEEYFKSSNMIEE